MNQTVNTKSVKNGVNDVAIAAQHSTTTSYVVGDVVMYNNVRYKCTTATSGEFIEANWEAESISSALASVVSTIKDQVISEVLNTMYPIGSKYVQLDSVEPATKFGGTWELDADSNNRALWVDNAKDAGTAYAGSLPNVKDSWFQNAWGANAYGAFALGGGGPTFPAASGTMSGRYINFNLSAGNSIYSAAAGADVVRPTSTTCKIWKRTA